VLQAVRKAISSGFMPEADTTASWFSSFRNRANGSPDPGCTGHRTPSTEVTRLHTSKLQAEYGKGPNSMNCLVLFGLYPAIHRLELPDSPGSDIIS